MSPMIKHCVWDGVHIDDLYGKKNCMWESVKREKRPCDVKRRKLEKIAGNLDSLWNRSGPEHGQTGRTGVQHLCVAKVQSGNTHCFKRDGSARC
jgi:hypothetical protein